MKYTVSVEETFEAAHWLPGHPKCGECHGHSYRVVALFSGFALNDQMMLIDFAKPKELVRRLVGILDHTTLNNKFPVPTAEVLAVYLWRELLDLPVTKVTVWETATSCAIVEPVFPIEWSTAFLEGEGCFTYRIFKQTPPSERYTVQPMVVYTQKETSILYRLCDDLRDMGIGANVSAQHGASNLKIAGWKGCRRLSKRIGHLLFTEVKREQFERFVRVFELFDEEQYHHPYLTGSSPKEVKQILAERGYDFKRWPLREDVES